MGIAVNYLRKKGFIVGIRLGSKYSPEQGGLSKNFLVLNNSSKKQIYRLIEIEKFEYVI